MKKYRIAVYKNGLDKAFYRVERKTMFGWASETKVEFDNEYNAYTVPLEWESQEEAQDYIDSCIEVYKQAERHLVSVIEK